MAIVLDTGMVYAYYDRSDRWHARSLLLFEAEQRALILPSPVVAEVDHLLGARLGRQSQLTFYSGIVDGYYFVADLPREGYSRVAELNRQFQDLDLGFVDAAVMAISESLGLPRIATTDRRHFERLATVFSFELLP